MVSSIFGRIYNEELVWKPVPIKETMAVKYDKLWSYNDNDVNNFLKSNLYGNYRNNDTGSVWFWLIRENDDKVNIFEPTIKELIKI